MSVQEWPATSLYPGYLIDDQGLWRSVRCTACGKPTGFVMDQLTDQRTLRLVHSHRCGPIGTNWDEAGPPGPGPAHARLLRSVTADSNTDTAIVTANCW